MGDSLNARWLRFVISVAGLMLAVQADAGEPLLAPSDWMDSELLELPPPDLEHLPLTSIRPNAIDMDSSEEFARLVRGDEVLEISNDALKRSGLYAQAIESSPELSREFQALEQQILQLEQARFELAQIERDLLEAADEDDAKVRLFARQTSLIQTIEATDVRVADSKVQFDRRVFATGLNGAQVASVRRQRSSHAYDTERYLLLDAMNSTPENNLGYTITRIHKSGELGLTTVPSEFLLPTPADPNDIFLDRAATGIQRLPDGLMINIADAKEENPVVRILGMPRFGAYYDTGVVGAGNIAESVSLLGSDDPGAGQTHFFQTGGSATTPFDLLFDTQVLNFGEHSIQFYVDANNDLDVDALDVEYLGVRAYNRQLGSFFEGWSLVVGQANTLYGFAAERPAGLENSRTLVGTVDRKNDQLPQLAVHAPLTEVLTWKVGIEEPYDDDVFFDPTMTKTELTRWPTLATNLSWNDKPCADKLELAALARTVGFQAASGAEYFSTNLGLAGLAKLADRGGASFIGVAGGNGVGDYIQGVDQSAVADATSIQAISAVGAYAGTQRVWRRRSGKALSELNLVYGYSFMETPPLLGPTANSKLHQGWVNYSRFFSDYMAVGVEYQYGFREVASGDQGEDHRFMVLLALRSAPTEQRTVTQGTAFFNGRTSEDVVTQYQLGGPAYAQEL